MLYLRFHYRRFDELDHLAGVIFAGHTDRDNDTGRRERLGRVDPIARAQAGFHSILLFDDTIGPDQRIVFSRNSA